MEEFISEGNAVGHHIRVTLGRSWLKTVSRLYIDGKPACENRNLFRPDLLVGEIPGTPAGAVRVRASVVGAGTSLLNSPVGACTLCVGDRAPFPLDVVGAPRFALLPRVAQAGIVVSLIAIVVLLQDTIFVFSRPSGTCTS